MNNWLYLQNDPSWFYLNSFSVGAMIPVAFFAITGFFLLAVKNKSKATLHLGICYIMMGLYNLGLVIASSIYHPAAVYHRWMAVPAILLAEIHASMLFFYYPDEKNPRATRLFFRSAYLLVIGVCCYFIFQTSRADKIFITLGQYWEFDATGENKLIAVVVEALIFVFILLTFWRAIACKGRDRMVVSLMGASVLLGSFVPGIFNLLNREGMVDRVSFQMAWTVFTMAGFFLLIMLYVNNAREKISFVGKLITVTAITILTILHFISHYSLKDRDTAYDETHVKDALLAYHTGRIPGDLAYQAVFDLRSGTLKTPAGDPLPVDPAAVKQQLYNAMVVETIRSLAEDDFRNSLTAYLNKETDSAVEMIRTAIESRLAETPKNGPALKRDILDLLTPTSGGGQRIYRIANNGASHYIAYAVADLPAGKIIETGFHYRQYRLYMHEAVFQYMVMIFILIALSRYGFYWFFYGLLVTPLKALTKGVYAVEGGNFNVSVPVVIEDEIGFITHAFNKMVASIREAKKTLQDEADNLLAAHASLEASHHEIRLLQHYLANIIESMPSALISIDENAKVTQWNAAAERLTGIRATDILGKTLWKVRSPFNKLEHHYHKVIDSQKPLLFSRERLEYTVDGDNKYYNIALYPLAADGVSGAVVRIDDITELEKMEQQLRQAQKMDTIGTLAGGLAHDFNNILGGIVGTLSVLKFKLAQGMPLSAETAGEYIDTMERAGRRAADMVQQLLSLSRKQELSFAPVDLNMTIKHVVKICENTFDKSIEIKTNFFSGYPVAKADPGQLEQILLNLCVNAAHAMTLMRPEGERKGGILTISLGGIMSDKFFCAGHPEARPDEAYWALSVQDTGVGMDTKTISKIFDPFFTTKEKGRGTGLGLAMVYNIVQQHRGFIDVYSEPGHGSTFCIYLPQLKTEGNASLIKERQELPRGQGVILIIDDEEIMREMAAAILTECGYTAIVAENGINGLEIFKKEHTRIVMVLLDMVMPKLSGKETFIRLKQIDPGLKVLLTSGFSRNEDIDAILELGVMDFIQKPFTIEELAQKTSTVINRKR